MTYRPSSYNEIVGEAVQAVAVALADGLDRLEVEFPAVSNVDGAAPPGFSGCGCPALLHRMRQPCLRGVPDISQPPHGGSAILLVGAGSGHGLAGGASHLHAGYKGSSDLYIDTNIQLALAAAKRLSELTGKRVHLLLPDETEYGRAANM